MYVQILLSCVLFNFVLPVLFCLFKNLCSWHIYIKNILPYLLPQREHTNNQINERNSLLVLIVINIAPLWSHSCTFIREEDWDLSKKKKKKRGLGTKLWDSIPFNSIPSSTCPHPTHKSLNPFCDSF